MVSEVRMPSPPSGPPRFVAAFYQPSSGWKIAAEAQTRAPVDYAVAAMIQTVQSRGQAPLVEIWGPSADSGTWEHLDSPVTASPSGTQQQVPTESLQTPLAARDERMRDRRHQVLMAALGAVGITNFEPGDASALAWLADMADEETARAIARWLSIAAD